MSKLDEIDELRAQLADLEAVHKAALVQRDFILDDREALRQKLRDESACGFEMSAQVERLEAALRLQASRESLREYMAIADDQRRLAEATLERARQIAEERDRYVEENARNCQKLEDRRLRIAELEMSAKWTTTPPTVPGLYWLRGIASANTTKVARVDWHLGELSVERIGDDRVVELSRLEYVEWAGPLEAPK